MLFNSINFLIFFTIIFIAYFSINHKHRWLLLLTASYYFYMSFKPEYVILLIISTITTYYCALQIQKTKSCLTKRFFLATSIIVNLGFLFLFKYFNFFTNSTIIDLVLPIGISFYTFQALSYIFDVYQEKIEPEKHLGIFALYISFFPQLVAGPIERASHLLPEFFKKHDFDYNRTVSGLRLMLWGFFKKMVIADYLSKMVVMVYGNVGAYSSIDLFLATLFFGFQIYCDFSGYTDIARGIARTLGFNLIENFNVPYFAKSIPDFWRRWHISLTSWFRDYIYLPLGGRIRWTVNIFAVFLISGLWHGANWTFVLWGLYHALLYVLTVKISFPKVPRFISIAITFLLVTFGWVFFRANSVNDAFYIFGSFLNGIGTVTIFGGIAGILYSAFLITLLLGTDLIRTRVKIDFEKIPLPIRWFTYIATILFILCFGIYKEAFIYFQF